MEKTKILVLVPVYKRPEIFKIFAENLNFPSWIEAKVVAVLSKEDKFLSQNVRTCTKHNFVITYSDNEPLGAKMNHGIEWGSLFTDWQYLMNIGSDDIINDDYWEKVQAHLLNGINMVGMNQIYAFNCYSNDTLKLKIDMIWGGGRLIKRDIIEQTIDKLGYIYTPYMSSGLDTDSQANIIQVTDLVPTIIDGCYLLDLKTDTNINTFLGLENIPHEEIDYSEIRDKFGDISRKCISIIKNRRVH